MPNLLTGKPIPSNEPKPLPMDRDYQLRGLRALVGGGYDIELTTYKDRPVFEIIPIFTDDRIVDRTERKSLKHLAWVLNEASGKDLFTPHQVRRSTSILVRPENVAQLLLSQNLDGVKAIFANPYPVCMQERGIVAALKRGGATLRSWSGNNVPVLPQLPAHEPTVLDMSHPADSTRVGRSFANSLREQGKIATDISAAR